MFFDVNLAYDVKYAYFSFCRALVSSVGFVPQCNIIKLEIVVEKQVLV